MIFDTHVHYDDAAFNEDREKVLKWLPSQGIRGAVNAGVDIESSKESVWLSKQYSYIYSAVGIHPQNLENNLDIDWIYTLERLISENKKVVAIGEIGLDYHFSSENKLKQMELFENQIGLSLKHHLPIVVHDREAHKDTIEILKKCKPKGIVHCFSGSLEMAKEVVKLGMYIGVGGVVTFKNAKNLVEVVKHIPLNNIVVETDSPYLAPVPFRGKRCDSSYIKFIVEKIAEILDEDVKLIYETTLKNALDIFNLN